MSARFLAIEAVDLAGKSTQLERAVSALHDRGLRVGMISYPDRTAPATGHWIARYLQGEFPILGDLPGLADGPAGGALLAQAVFAINRRECAPRLRDLLDKHDVVLASRSGLSGAAYARALGVDPTAIDAALAALESDLPQPERYLVLDLDPRGLEVRPRSEGLDAFERDRALQLRVRAAYQSLAAARPDVELIDGEGSPDLVGSRIQDALERIGLFAR